MLIYQGHFISNKLIDHVLIAVSNEEFNELRDLSNSDSRVIYKKTIDQDWNWEAIYIGYSENIYLEVVLKENYPSKIGLAISSLGDEKNLLDDLEESLPDLEIRERATKEGMPWYNAYFCEKLESEYFFIWFMEYIGDYRKFRKKTIPNEIPEFGSNIKLNLDDKTIHEFLKVLNFCGLQFEKNKIGYKIFDVENRYFQISINNQKNNVELKVKK